MIESALIATLALAQTPVAVPTPEALERADVCVVVQATETHFAATNVSDDPSLLLFGTAELGLVASLRLLEGQAVVYPFSRGALDGMWLEVVSLGTAGWRNTGALALVDVQKSEHGTLWVEVSRDCAVGWTWSSEGIAHAAPRSGLLPESLLNYKALGLHDYASSAPAVHVPVVTPKNDEKSNKPPVIEDRPLPPV